MASGDGSGSVAVPDPTAGDDQARFALRMRGIVKTFGRTQALRGVDFQVRKGTVHGLVGANGAGKSTLMKIAEGAVRPSAGELLVGPTRIAFSEPGEARASGLGMVFQERSLVPTLSVLDNIFLNAERTLPGRLVHVRAERAEASRLFERLGTSVPLDAEVGQLGIGEQQMVELAKALRLAKVALVLDEPTSALSDHEVQRLFGIVRQIAALGTGVVFITHHLNELFDLCDEVTVLRDGRVSLSCPVRRTDMVSLVRHMVGEDLARGLPEPAARAAPPPGQAALRVEELSVPGRLTGVSFDIVPGEILGVAGLAGSGRKELLRALFGAAPVSGGRIRGPSGDLRLRAPADAIRRGIFLVPEDRHRHGLVVDHSVEANVTLPLLGRLRRGLLYDRRRSTRLTHSAVRELAIKAEGPEQPVAALSGGNQQKVVVAKALSAGSRLLLLDEPSSGVDVRTAAELRERVRRFVDDGNAAVWSSSDLHELVAVADRLLVLVDGRLKRVLANRPAPVSAEALTHAIQREDPAAEGGAT